MLTFIFIAALVVAAIAAVIGGIVWIIESINERDNGRTLDEQYEDDDYFSDVQDAVRDDGSTNLDGQQKLWETGQMPVVGGGDSIPPQHRAEYARMTSPVPVDEVDYSRPKAFDFLDVENPARSKAGTPPPADWAQPIAKSPSGQAPPMHWAGEHGPEELLPPPAPDSKFERPWWDDVPAEHQAAVREHVEAILRVSEAGVPPSAAPHLEQEQPAAPEAPSVDPEAVQALIDAYSPGGIAAQEDFTGQFDAIKDKQEHPELYVSHDEWMAKAEDELKLWQTQRAIELAQWRAQRGLPDCE